MTARINPPFPLLLLVLSGKGGVGKSLLSLSIVDLLELNNASVDVIQIDDQNRLSAALNRDIHSVDISILKRSRRDPNALITAFSRTYSAIEGIPKSSKSVLIDIGATQQHALLDYAALVEMDDDLTTLGIHGIAFVPVVADTESIQQAIRQIESLRKVLPSLTPVIVLNQRDGLHSDLSPESTAGQLYRRNLLPLTSQITTIAMPRIEAGSWQLFERHNSRFLTVIGQDVQTIMHMTGLSRPEAKVARGDVADWFQKMEQSLSTVLPFQVGTI